MNDKKKVRPYIVKAYLKSNIPTSFMIPITTILFFGLYTFILDGVASEDGFTIGILKETISNTAALAGGMCFTLLIVVSVLFVSSSYESIAFGATRKEAHVTYEIYSGFSYLYQMIVYVTFAILSKVVSGVNRYYDKMLDIAVIFLSLFAVLKLLCSIYINNTFKLKCTCVILMIMTIVAAGCSCIYTIIIQENSLVIFDNHMWAYPLIVLVAVVAWFVSVRILSKKRELICLSDCRI